LKVRSLATVGLLALSAWLLAGCAGNPTYDAFETGNRPQLLIPAANRSEVKGLAMGAARTKGWTIVKSTDDLVVAQRPLDPGSPSATALGVNNSVIPPMVEIVSAFREQDGGVNVAIGAVVVSQPPGEKAPKRTDYTDNYRADLTQQLESLRSNWTVNRQRVANAMPSQSPPPGPPPPPTPGSSTDNPLVKAWGETLAEANASRPGKDSVTATPKAPAAPATSAATQPQVTRSTPPPDPTPSPAPALNPAPSSPPRTSAAPAPVVDGTNALAAAPATPHPAEPPTSRPSQPAAEPVAPRDNMLTLSQASGSGTWAYYAEQYARLRGCNVSDAGSQLVESRADGEIHRVPCIGADSYLLKCQNGVCRSLE
jgi:hypothetical protein